MQRNDYEYFRQREQEERAHAERAQELTARRAHMMMAERYAERHRAMAPPSRVDNAA